MQHQEISRLLLAAGLPQKLWPPEYPGQHAVPSDTCRFDATYDEAGGLWVSMLIGDGNFKNSVLKMARMCGPDTVPAQNRGLTGEQLRVMRKIADWHRAQDHGLFV